MKRFINLDLDEYLNYKIIDSGTTDNSNDSDLSLTKKPEPYRVVYHDELFKPGNLPASGEAFEFEGIPFVFPKFSGEGYDNVCCEGQKIDFPAGNYSKVHIIGFCECEGFTEKFIFQSADSKVAATVEIFLFNSWKGIEHWSHERNPEMCRNAFLATTITESPRGVYCSSQNIKKGKITSVTKMQDSNSTDESVLLPEGKITSVILPSCPPMHVFSITLESSGV